MPFKYNPHTDELDFYGIAGPSGGSTDNAVARWDGTGGIALQDSSVLINDAGNIGVGATPTATEQLKIVNDQADDALGQLLLKGLATQTADELEIQHESGNVAARMVCAGSGGLIQTCFDNPTATAVSVALEATSGATINFGTHADRDAYGIVGAYSSVLNVESRTRDIILRSGTVTPIIQMVHTSGNVGVRVAAPTQMLQVGDGVIEPHTIYVKGPNSGTSYTCLHLERKYPQIQMTDTSGSIFYIWNLGNQMRFGGSAGSAENSTFYIDHGTGDETTMYMNCQLRLQGSGVTHGADYADFNVDGNGALTIDTVDSDGAVGHINLVPDGKVAIGGTTDYTRALNVLGGIQVRESDDGNIGVQIAPDDNEGFFQVYYNGAEYVRFRGDPSYACYIRGDNRKFGIGTYEPDTNLEVNSTTGGVIRLTYNDDNGSATDYCDFQVGSDGDLTITTVDSDGAAGDIALMPDGNVGIGTDSPSGKLEVSTNGENLWAVVALADTAYANGIDIHYSGARVDKKILRARTSAGSVLEVTTDSTVGIGTNAPATLLHLSKDDAGSHANRPILKIENTKTGGGYITRAELLFATHTAGDVATVPAIRASGGNIQIEPDPTSGHVLLGISDAGFVGIKTSNPTKSLEVNAVTGGCLRLTYNDNDGSATDYCDFQVGSDGDLTVTTVDSDGAAGDIALMPDGNVGIGTSTPNNLLTIKKAASSVIFDIESDVDQLGVIYFSDTTQGRGQIRYNHTDDEMTFWTTAGQKAVIDSTGQVGIGIASPDSQLTLYSAAASTTRISIHNDKAASAGMAVLQLKDIQTASSDDDWNLEHGRYDGMLSFYHNGTKMVIDDDGNVGIGETTPAALLHCDQSSTTGAKPVVTVDQADVSEEFIRFIGTSADTVLTQTLVEAGDEAGSTLAGWLKIYVSDDGNQITDQAYYVPFYTLNA